MEIIYFGMILLKNLENNYKLWMKIFLHNHFKLLVNKILYN